MAGGGLTGFPRRLGLDRQRVDTSRQFPRQNRINQAVALDPALPFEGLRYDIDPEMRLAARPVTGMAFMQMRFVRDVEALRRESFVQLVGDSVFGAHGGGNTATTARRQWRFESEGFAMSRLEAFGIALS
jgi:hypothetical protein